MEFATLLRHFPTREALFEALTCTNLDVLTKKAAELEASDEPDAALLSWFQEWMTFAQSYNGVVTLMAAAHSNPELALYVACAAVHSASARLLLRAQEEGSARKDMNGDDLFALMTSLGWAVDQPSFAPRSENLICVVTSAILTNPPSAQASA